MELQPASLAQIQRGRDGRLAYVGEDILDIVKQVREVDSSLRVSYNEYGEYYVVKELCGDGRERLVLTAQYLDQRIPERLRRLRSVSYHYGAEVDRLDAQAERDRNHAFAEEVGPIGERLAHALRKDLQVQNKIYLPSDWKCSPTSAKS